MCVALNTGIQTPPLCHELILSSDDTHTAPASMLPSSHPHPQCALAYKKMGIAPIVMSAGELESGNAGEPAKLMRQRYREVSGAV